MKEVLSYFYMITIFCFTIYAFIKIGDIADVDYRITLSAFIFYGAGLYYVIKDDK